MANVAEPSGHQARALIHAVCCSSTHLGYYVDRMSHIIARLSLPPLASVTPSDDQARPHTSYLWLLNGI